MLTVCLVHPYCAAAAVVVWRCVHKRATVLHCDWVHESRQPAGLLAWRQSWWAWSYRSVLHGHTDCIGNGIFGSKMLHSSVLPFMLICSVANLWHFRFSVACSMCLWKTPYFDNWFVYSLQSFAMLTTGQFYISRLHVCICSLAVIWQADGWRSVHTAMQPFFKLLWPLVDLMFTCCTAP